jgi:hypothetical protein
MDFIFYNFYFRIINWIIKLVKLSPGFCALYIGQGCDSFVPPIAKHGHCASAVKRINWSNKFVQSRKHNCIVRKKEITSVWALVGQRDDGLFCGNRDD